MIPYLRTYKSTVSKLKSNVGGNRSGLKRVVQEIGGKGEDSSTAILLDSFPGNERQVKHLKGECQP